MKLLSICSSKRPEMLKRMIKSFLSTKELDSELFIYISEKDKDNFNFDEFPLTNKVTFHIGTPKYYAEVLNFVSTNLYPDVEYYQEINDDHIYRTQGWDKILIEEIEKNGGIGLSAGDDLWKNDRSSYEPSGVVVSGNIVRCLGWMVYPGFRQYNLDVFLWDLGSSIKRFFVRKDVIIEHMHCFAKDEKENFKGVKDEFYKNVYCDEERNIGNHTLNKYRSEKTITLNKINNLIEHETNNR